MTKPVSMSRRADRMAMLRHAGTALAALALLTACGGGSSSSSGGDDGAPTSGSPPPPPAVTCTPAPEGAAPAAVWPSVVGGTIDGRVDPSFILAATREGNWLMLYGPDLATTPTVSGFVYAGPGAWCSSPNPTSYNGIDYGTAQASTYLYASVDAMVPTVSGSIRYPTASHAISGGTLPGATYQFSQPARIADVEGTWHLADRNGASVMLSVTESGTVVGSYQGCTLNGALSPVAGANLFELTVSLDACPATRWQTLQLPYGGLVLAYPLAAGGWQMVVWAETNNGIDWDHVLAIGRR